MVTASGITLQEWETRSADTETILADRRLTPEAQAVAKSLSKANMLRVSELRSGLSIQSYSHVGKVRLGDFEVTVVPKLPQPSLLNLLRYAYGFRQLRLFSSATQSLEETGFADLLVSQLNAEVGELIARGLHRNYLSQRDYLASPRGRIDIQQIAADGGLIQARLPCHYHSRVEDTLLNRVLLAGLKMAAGLASDLHLRRDALRLAATFADTVQVIVITSAVLAQLSNSLNRLTTSYEPAIRLIQLLSESQGVALEDAATTGNLPGFLFDMNRFFQALLSRFLHDHLDRYVIKDEYRMTDMMRYLPGFNPRNRHSPALRPDFVLLQGHRIRAILDAKYRDLWERSLPNNMLYQLTIYATTHPQHVATILYPTVERRATESRIALREPIYGTEIGQVQLRPVVLPLLEALINERSAGEKASYANWLAFGQ